MGIKSLELEPTRENILNTISRDLIDRNNSVWQFVRFCDAQDSKCAIALDAQWGYGKTFFVKQAQMLMESFNSFTSAISDEEKTTIRNVFSKYTGTGDNAIEIQPQVCVYYDAWVNDNDKDPILSLVYEIVRTTACEYSFTDYDWLKIAASIIDVFTGKDTKEIIDLLRGEDPISEIKAQKDIHSIVEAFLDSLLYEKGNRLVIFIDELDRCKPSYAVQLLERIKHYFSNDRITFVFSVNVSELQHTIKRYYGESFDACRYLDRFFDYRISLPPANMTNYYQEIGLGNGLWAFEIVCKAVARHFSFGLRETEKFYRTAKIAAFDPTHKKTFSGFPDENGLAVGMILFVPIIIGLRMVDSDLYNDFVKGNNSAPLIEIMGDGEIASSICALFLNRNETFYSNNRSEEMTVVRLEDKLNQAYNAIFDIDDDRSWQEVNVGKCLFSKQTRDTVFRVTSLLSKYTRFE